jgi:hypothetical protein
VNLQGSGATEDCCSKCFLENQKKLGCQPVQQKREEPAPLEPVEETAQAMEVETARAEAPEPALVLKKKKKKTSYKAMMASVTQSAPRDAEKEKESIRKATGGGAFSKIEKI